MFKCPCGIVFVGGHENYQRVQQHLDEVWKQYKAAAARHLNIQKHHRGGELCGKRHGLLDA